MASKNDMNWSQMVPKFMIVSVKIGDEIRYWYFSPFSSVRGF